MKAFAVPHRGSDVVEHQVETPTPTGRQVLLKVTHAGICHTDTHVQDGGYDLGAHGFLSMTSRGLTYPAVMGHEVVGEVIAAGDLATDVAPGDTRLIYPWLGCGKCSRCSIGDENHCSESRAHGIYAPGGFAEQILVRDEKYLIRIEGLDPAWAATLACSGITAYSSAKKALSYAESTDTIAVVGAGGVGLMAIAVLRALGHSSIAAIDIRDENLTVASRLGATVTLNSANGGVVEKLRESTTGRVAAVVDFVNTGATVDSAFAMLDKGGTLVHVGLFGGEFPLPTALLALKMLVLQGNYVGSLSDLARVVDLAKSGELPHIPIINESLSSQGVNAGLKSLRGGTVAGRIVLSP